MELLDRYLQAVRFWLPRAQQDDIIAELSEDIRSQIEEKESALGRKLNDAEIESLLKQRGRPLLVANRYLPQRALIGPVLFPAYVFVLRIVALGYLVPWTFVWVGLMLFDPRYRNAHSLAEDAARAWGPFWGAALMAVGATRPRSYSRSWSDSRSAPNSLRIGIPGNCQRCAIRAAFRG